MRPFPEITLGVQYYRQPTPLPGEWDRDLGNIRGMGFDVIQLRPQWRWHERNEGELDFADLDRLFDLAEKHKLKVLFKFLLPAGPEWLFDRYDAYRVRPNGERNRFIRAAVRRYRDRPNLLAWHAWNEPRSRPADDCACPDSMAKYRAWLAERFGTIEAFNDFTGLAVSGKGADFGAVKAPVNPGDYAGWLLFRSASSIRAGPSSVTRGSARRCRTRWKTSATTTSTPSRSTCSDRAAPTARTICPCWRASPSPTRPPRWT